MCRRFPLLIFVVMLYGVIATANAQDAVSMGFYLNDVTAVRDADQAVHVDFIVGVGWPVSEDEKAVPVPQVHNDLSLRMTTPGVQVVDERRVTYYRFVGQVSSKMDFGSFPLDRQQLVIDVSMTGSALPLILTDKIEHNPDLSIPGWSIGAFEAGLADRTIMEQEIETFRFALPVERRPGYLIWRIVVPTLLIVIMSWAIFWIDPIHVVAQIGVATTSMLTLIAHQFSFVDLIPQVHYLTRLDAFTLTAMGFVFIAFAEAAVTSYLSGKSKITLARKLDRGARVICPIAYAVAVLLVLVW